MPRPRNGSRPVVGAERTVAEVSAAIDAAVEDCIAGNVPLEVGICQLLFGRKPHAHDDAWPEWSRPIWIAAVARWQVRHREELTRLGLTKHKPHKPRLTRNVQK
jgi:hypothetical protein